VAVAGGGVFTAISSGNAHSCGLTGAGALFCWGNNAKGQIGDGTVAPKPAPTAVGAALVWRSVSAGDTHTCAVTTGNVAYCWGDNEYGQLGDGTIGNRLLPMKVAFQP
jgi:alpha-tubulin suppressor-like RCC1 family protein